MIDPISFAVGFWSLWLSIGIPLAWRKWRRWRRICVVVGGAPWRVVLVDILYLLFLWPSWILARPLP